MNDPHVVALNYRITHSDSIDYSEAEALSRDEPEFRLTVESQKVRFEFKEHYATEEEAREELADYIRVWEFDATLSYGNPDSFRLEFEKAEIIDRNPIPGEVRLSGRGEARFAMGGAAALTTVVDKYPSPPSDIALNSEIETMHQRYMRYRQDREPILAMAYFCLTVLEQNAGGRPNAAAKFKIEKRVLEQIGNLSANKGGPEARKAGGTTAGISPQERRFLQRAVKTIIRRAAETEHSRAQNLPIVLLSDFSSPRSDFDQVSENRN